MVMAQRKNKTAGAGATEGARRATGVAPAAGADEPSADVRPDPEVPAQARRRRFNAEYKRRVVEEADACTESGQVGALLRREGLYSSHLTKWRRQRDEGALSGLAAKKRGRKKRPVNPLAARVAELEKENRRLHKKLHQAETVIDVQKKVSELLGIQSSKTDNEGET